MTGRLSQAAIDLLWDMDAGRVMRIHDRDRWWLVDNDATERNRPVDRRLMQALVTRGLMVEVPAGQRHGGRVLEVDRAIPSTDGQAVLDAATVADRGED
jgi:hypothetical protein